MVNFNLMKIIQYQTHCQIKSTADNFPMVVARLQFVDDILFLIFQSDNGIGSSCHQGPDEQSPTIRPIESCESSYWPVFSDAAIVADLWHTAIHQ
jgi:hypothetical protein